MTWLAALILGYGIGLVYFGGLWLTVRLVAQGRGLRLLLGISRGVRLALVAVVFYGLSLEGPEFVVAALGGLWLARWCLLRHLGGPQHAR